VIPAGGASDGLVVTFGTEPSPPAKGDNTVVVTVKNPDGSPLESGNVKAVFSMPAMPSMNMPAMRSDAALQHEGQGRYRGTGQLSMGGTWTVAITVADGAKELATRQTSIVAKE
jgi:Cu(I)/Ag(I) efflux system membrane fusion protein/cobalt-zinc-cadmium efflux system membrane fusion protein